jgi:hypothetical protein
VKPWSSGLRCNFPVCVRSDVSSGLTRVRATQVVIEERVDGTLRITQQGHGLAYALITARPGRPAVRQTESPRHRLVIQARTHPWRKRALPLRELVAVGSIT